VKDVPRFLSGSYAYSEIESQKYKKLQDFQINNKELLRLISEKFKINPEQIKIDHFSKNRYIWKKTNAKDICN
jgi:hypothetical protein